MDLSHALDAHADAVARDAADRLASDANKSLLRARVVRGQRIRTFGVATGVAAGAVILMATGAWAAPHVFGEPTQIAPIAPPSATPSATPPPYVHTALDELPTDRDPGYVGPVLGALQLPTSMACTDMVTAEIPLDPSLRQRDVSGLPVWLDISRMYDEDPIPLFVEAAGNGLAVQTQYGAYPDYHKSIVALTDSYGNTWAFRATYEFRDDRIYGPSGTYVTLMLDQACGGGTHQGGPMPPGHYRARELTVPAVGDGESVLRDLGSVEVLPFNLGIPGTDLYTQSSLATPTPGPTASQ